MPFERECSRKIRASSASGWSPVAAAMPFPLPLKESLPRIPAGAPTAGISHSRPRAMPAKTKTPPPFVIDRLQFKQDTVGYLDHRRTHIYLFDVASKKITQVTSGDFDDNEPAWSPDGKLLAFTSNRSTDPDRNYNTDIWVVVADNSDKGAHLTQITTNPGPDRAPAWSPDGKWITFVTQTDVKAMIYATHHLAIAPSTGGEQRVLSLAFDRSVRRPRFSADGRSIYFIADDDGTENLCRIAIAGGEVTRPIGGHLSVSSYSLGKDGAVAAQISTLDRPDEIFLLPPAGPAEKFPASFPPFPHPSAPKASPVLPPNPRGSPGYGKKFGEPFF